MSITLFMLRAGTALAVTVLACMLTGCISDAGVSPAVTSQYDSQTPPLRYYGGPKSPMWPAQP